MSEENTNYMHTEPGNTAVPGNWDGWYKIGDFQWSSVKPVDTDTKKGLLQAILGELSMIRQHFGVKVPSCYLQEMVPVVTSGVYEVAEPEEVEAVENPHERLRDMEDILEDVDKYTKVSDDPGVKALLRESIIEARRLGHMEGFSQAIGQCTFKVEPTDEEEATIEDLENLKRFCLMSDSTLLGHDSKLYVPSIDMAIRYLTQHGRREKSEDEKRYTKKLADKLRRWAAQINRGGHVVIESNSEADTLHLIANLLEGSCGSVLPTIIKDKPISTG
jgi:hypothetical protein